MHPKNSLTYRDAGVDIDAGNELVRRIKPHVRSTRRPGADGEIGGFGGPDQGSGVPGCQMFHCARCVPVCGLVITTLVTRAR